MKVKNKDIQFEIYERDDTWETRSGYKSVEERDRRNRQARRRRKKRIRRLKRLLLLVSAVLLLAGVFLLCRAFAGNENAFFSTADLREKELKKYASDHQIALSDYPESLIDLYKRNGETKDFVFEYPLKKDSQPEIDLGEYADSESVPLLMQWDQRWGYQMYAGNYFGLSGCGPTCLSMVAIYLSGDTSMNPGWMGEFSSSHGYASDGNGSAWALFSEGGAELGFDVTEIPLSRQWVMDNLDVGNPIVAIMGPGDFTTSGHFIVLSGSEDGKIRINDPNSRENSEKLWDYDEISDQIRDLWVFRN
ncbi:MAG: C39 family peptidase [Fusicatenibacter sp.]|nr:C39 family peptidase [Fusicatenibacter sp.]